MGVHSGLSRCVVVVVTSSVYSGVLDTVSPWLVFVEDVRIIHRSDITNLDPLTSTRMQ